jgi:hypothetical protein
MKILLSLILVFLTTPLFGEDRLNVRPSWSGSWYNPDQSGHGINVQILDEDRTVIYWYTYDLDGKPFWLAALGFNSEFSLVTPSGHYPWGIRVEATAYYHEGMIFSEFDPVTKSKQEWGTIVLDFQYISCNYASMEWYPVMEGFSQGSTYLTRLTTLNELDCVFGDWWFGDYDEDWEVQFGFDAEHKYPVETVVTFYPDFPHDPHLAFEFVDETGCLWSGQVSNSYLIYRGTIRANWNSQCGAPAESVHGDRYFEYELCNSVDECVRKDLVMIFEDAGETLIFSR